MNTLIRSPMMTPPTNAHTPAPSHASRIVQPAPSSEWAISIIVIGRMFKSRAQTYRYGLFHEKMNGRTAMTIRTGQASGFCQTEGMTWASTRASTDSPAPRTSMMLQAVPRKFGSVARSDRMMA